jgi:large subunit ribosomal protein L21
MFAVIKTGGRQYRVVPNDVLEIGKIAGDVGTIVQLGEVLVLGGDTPVLGTPPSRARPLQRKCCSTSAAPR